MSDRGIYALYWEEPALVYIGRAINTLNRFNRHINDLKNNKHCNYKVQDAYNKYGKPSLIPLSYDYSEEALWIKEFNTTVDGLNITSGGDGAGEGVDNSSSKYSKAVVLKVFSLLYKSDLSYNFIKDKLSVPLSLVKDIAIGDRHTWLSSVYPDKYSLMLNRLPSRVNSNSIRNKYTLVLLKSPTEEIHKITSIKEFCTEYGLNPGNISSLISDRFKSSKGWTIYEKKPAK
jgi:hypothetical protein